MLDFYEAVRQLFEARPMLVILPIAGHLLAIYGGLGLIYFQTAKERQHFLRGMKGREQSLLLAEHRKRLILSISLSVVSFSMLGAMTANFL
jgi:hypothetical protein